MASGTLIQGFGGDDVCLLANWALTTADPIGTAVQHPQWHDRVLSVGGGTWGGATMVVEGGNDGVNYAALKDVYGNAAQLTADGIIHIQMVPQFMRVRLSVVGVGASIAPKMLIRRPTDLRV